MIDNDLLTEEEIKYFIDLYIYKIKNHYLNNVDMINYKNITQRLLFLLRKIQIQKK